MKKRFKPDTEESGCLSREQAEQIFTQISGRLKLKQSCGTVRKKGYFFKQFYRKYILKRAALGAVTCLALLLLLPGTVTPASISKVSAAPVENGHSARVEFFVDCLIPVQTVSASINSKTLNVSTKGYQHYAVDVPENGSLLLEIASLTGLRHTEEIKIDSIDDKAPSVVRHTVGENTITIYLTDHGGSGVDYSGITAYSPSLGRQILPVSFNEEENYVVFLLPKSPLYITVPDQNENKKLAVLTPPD